MLERVVELGEVQIVVHAPLIRNVLAKMIERSLSRAFEEDSANPDLAEMQIEQRNFSWIAACTKSVTGFEWKPLTLEAAQNPSTVLASFVQWLTVLDRTMHDAWADEVIALDQPIDKDLGPMPPGIEESDPNA